MLIDIRNLIGNNYNLELESVPLRVWTDDWPVPRRINFEKYIVNLNTSHKTNVNLNRYALWGEIETIEDFKKRTYKNKKPKQWGKGKKSGRRFDYKKLDGKIWIKILSKSFPFDLKSRKLIFDGRYLRLSLKKHEIALWYISGEGQIRFIILPKTIRLTKELFELIGILDGEMCKKINKRGGSSLKISNTEPIIIRKILEEFKSFFNILFDSWTASLTINNKRFNFKRENDEELKNFWSRRINLKSDRFAKTTFQQKYNSNFSDKGIMQIRYSNTLFFLTLLNLMKKLRTIIINEKNYCAAYIRGVAAAEGGIGKRGDKLRMVHIGGMQDVDKIFYSDCLRKLGITSIRSYKLRIEVYGLNNFRILRKINLFQYHPKRNKIFLRVLKNLEKNYKGKAIQS